MLLLCSIAAASPPPPYGAVVLWSVVALLLFAFLRLRRILKDSQLSISFAVLSCNVLLLLLLPPVPLLVLVQIPGQV